MPPQVADDLLHHLYVIGTCHI